MTSVLWQGTPQHTATQGSAPTGRHGAAETGAVLTGCQMNILRRIIETGEQTSGPLRRARESHHAAPPGVYGRFYRNLCTTPYMDNITRCDRLC